MTIVLNAAGGGAVMVENYNDGERLAATRDLAQAVEIAAAGAEESEAVVRVRLGDRLGAIDITTSPRALFFKIYLLRLVMFLLGRLVGMPDLARLLDRAAETGAFPRAPARARPAGFPPEKNCRVERSAPAGREKGGFRFERACR